jgi:hypothetical protein
MEMITLSVTFESFTNENEMEIYKRNEKLFITIENLSNVKSFTNVKIESFTVEKNFTWDFEMETLSFQKKEFTFVYEITKESASKCKIFLDLLLEMDYEFTYVI